ncbi:helix-turn-helix domain-containing protein [Cryobacterium psychrophilum]|nr:helix-turn-helix domain-containing protein [Cryobacterium psychrophilum]TDW31404.1 excisionase family DNA binding protein [Cryobacterium psychrophilum]
MPKTPPMTDPLANDMLRAYSLPDVAERLDVSLKTVRRMIDAGELKIFRPHRNGRTVRVSERSLRDLFAHAA